MRKKIALILFIVMALGFGILIWFTYVYREQYLSQQILPNIYIDKMDMGGLTKNQANQKLKKYFQDKQRFKIVLKFQNKTIANISAKSLEYDYPIQSVVDQAYYIGRGDNLASLYQFMALKYGQESYHFTVNPNYNEKYLANFLLELAEAYKQKPIEARFEFKEGRVTVFQPEKSGFQLEVRPILQQINDELQQQKFKPQKKILIKVKKTKLEPKMKLKSINNLGIQEPVGIGNSLFAGSAPERIHNIQTGAAKLNGIIIKPDEVFSFNQALGEISSQTGYQPAWVIKSGKTVLGDGGGICQVSTTLFRAAMQAGLPIIERTAHAYRVNYYEQDSDPGLDATIYSPSVDLKFKNDHKTALLIQSTVDFNQQLLSFTFYGTKDGRQISLSPVTIWNVAPPPPAEYIDDPTLPEGQTKQIDFAAWGSSTKFTYQVTYPQGEVKKQEFVSHFRPWKAIYLVGKAN